MKTAAGNRIYRFADVEVNPATFLVRRRDGEVAALEPKAFEVLLFLLQNRGRVVLKAELLDAVWEGANVTENVLSREIVSLRRALGDQARDSSIIQTVHGRGYRFIASVEEEDEDEAVGSNPATIPVVPAAAPERTWRSTGVALGVILGCVILIAGAFAVRRTSPAEYRPKDIAQQEYLAGQYFMNGGTREALDKAVQHFQRAVESDDGFALAYATLADSYSRYERYRSPPPEYLPQSRAAVQRALAIDSNDSYAHSIAGRLAYRYDWDLIKAGEALDRARTLTPNISHQWFGWYYMSMGQRDRADREFERFAAAQPLLVYANATYGEYFYWTRRYDRAMAQLKYTLEMNPRAPRAHELLGMTYQQLGQTKLAESEFKSAMELSNGVVGTASLVHLYGSAGETERAASTFDQLRAISTTTYISPYEMAIALLGLGKVAEAMTSLEQGYTDRSLSPANLEFEPRLDSIRETPEMVNLVGRIRR